MLTRRNFLRSLVAVSIVSAIAPYLPEPAPATPIVTKNITSHSYTVKCMNISKYGRSIQVTYEQLRRLRRQQVVDSIYQSNLITFNERQEAILKILANT